MIVLLGISQMAHRTGAELFVRDLALGLNRRGHSIVVYSPILGDMVDELRDQSIACVSDIDKIEHPPDIIIGNTQVETTLCLATFPLVPAISICHDRVNDHGRPPRFSRVRAYVAVDANCAERLTMENGLPASDVSIIQNGVDLRRFRPRSALPARPRKAAIFNNYATHGPDTDAVRRACASEGIELDVIGTGAGNQARSPEQILPNYDLVFAKARCAAEAMAVGCAVVVLSEGLGMAGMVASDTVADWRRWNFGRRLLARHAIEEARVRDAIRSYSAADATAVSDYIRSNASLDATVDAIEAMAGRILQSPLGQISPGEELREFARYVHDFLLTPDVTRLAFQAGAGREIARREVERARDYAERARDYAEHAHAELGRVHGELGRVRLESERAATALRAAQDELARFRKKLTKMRSSYSWRATAPFRKLRKRAGTLFRRARES